MSGKTAKIVRRLVFGDYSIRSRQYYKKNGTIIADERRRKYQRVKKLLKEGVFKIWHGKIRFARLVSSFKKRPIPATPSVSKITT
jgi:hypothetical protein